MNNLYTNTIRKDGKNGLIILGVILGISGVVLFLQSIKFVSSLWVLLQFGHQLWQEHLWGMLKFLRVWAVLTGIIFSMEFVAPPLLPNDLKKLISRMATGFVTGFIFPYFLVLMIGILIYIPLGIISLFIRDIITFATLEFTWLVAAYIIFIWIAVDTPLVLFEVIKKGNWYFKLLGVLLILLLGIEVLGAIAGGLSIIMKNSIWQTNTSLLSMGTSLLLAIIMGIKLLRREAIIKIIFAVIIVFIASIITGNISYGVFHWGDFPSMILAGILGPIVYSRTAKIILKNGINSVAVIFGLFGGGIAGLLIDQYTKLKIIGQGWFGILCGTIITIGFGVAFGLIYGPMMVNLLVSKTRIKPVIAVCLGVGLFLGIIIGMVLGGFMAR